MATHTEISRMLAAIVLCAGPTVAAAEDCPLMNGVYAQPGTPWVLRFDPVPDDAASNQVNAFNIAIPGTDRVLVGSVYVPNGFSPNYGIMNVACGFGEPETQKPCDLWEGTVYAGVPDGIATLPKEDQPAPRQVLFPGFGSQIWYSNYRDAMLDNAALDVFTFSSCAL